MTCGYTAPDRICIHRIDKNNITLKTDENNSIYPKTY